MTDTAAKPRAPRIPLLVGFGAGAATIAALLVYAAASGSQHYLERGDGFPGFLTTASMLVGTFLGTLLGGVCLGGCLSIVVGAHPDPRGVIDVGVYRTHLLVERAAAAWALCAAVMVVVSAADDAGLPVTGLVSSPAIAEAIAANQRSIGWIVTACCAAVVAVVGRWSVQWISHALLLLPAGIAVVAVPVTGNAAAGPNHDYATSSVIVFSLAIAVLIGVKLAGTMQAPVDRRARAVAMAAGAVALGYGVVLCGLLVPFGDALGGAYGRLSLAAAVLLSSVWIGDVVGWRRGRGSIVMDLAAATTMIAAAGALSAMAVRTAPLLLAHSFTAWDVYLGYQLPGPPSLGRVLTTWRFDTLIGMAAIAAAAAYAVGVVRLRRRGDSWPPGRTVAWMIGCAALLFVSSSGVKAYGSAMFSVHMGEHMAMNMFIPVVLVLGAPATLALRVLPAQPAGLRPGPREWLLTILHSRFTRFVSHPGIVFVVFVASLYLVYFTAVFDTLARYHWGHELMSIHFLVTGYLFYWTIIGVDPGPRRLPFLGRLGMLFAVMPFHAFFGIATMSTESILGGSFYRYLSVPWLGSLKNDQWLGGAIAWGASEVPVLIVLIALITQWARQDRRDGERTDRQSDTYHNDDELDAYNAMLRELARSRR